MFYQIWTEDQERSLIEIFERTPGSLWDKAKKVNTEWNGSGYYTKNLITLVNKYHKLKKKSNF